MKPANSDELDCCPIKLGNGNSILLSQALAKLLLSCRRNYAWPDHETPLASQARIIQLERDTETLLSHLDDASAHEIMLRVSKWAGNRKYRLLEAAVPTQNGQFAELISALGHQRTYERGLRGLSEVPGISLVVASKILRFCAPEYGASVDRHCSYFFNSLRILSDSGEIQATSFKREWKDVNHKESRLASFSKPTFDYNLCEYLVKYLPLLGSIAAGLNEQNLLYECAVSRQYQYWRPADVEMAAYQWWSRNGSK